jgi:restriction system protein
MGIPKLYSITLPLLQYLKDESPRGKKELTDHVCSFFKLSEEEQRQQKPSGGESVIGNRTGWAKFELKKAGLIEVLSDKTMKITSSGLEILQKNPDEINRKFLMTIPVYYDYIHKLKGDDDEEDTTSIVVDDNASPQDLMDLGWKKYQKELESEILEKVKKHSPDFFEQLVVDLIQKMGYGKGTVTGKSGDGGIDGVIEGDKLGLDLILLQAKRYQGTVPGGDVRNFAGSMEAKKSKKGIFLTTSDFSHDTRKFVEDVPSRIILINGKQLTELMFEYNVGFSSGVRMELKTIDEDYFS